MGVGEIKIVGVGEKFDVNLPVKGTLTFVFPDGSLREIDVLDILDVEWYEN
ncbi:hypothetical protein [Bacillus sp. T33-2]|uniref:hypothetical protein n=1 Tax=Bacillus sp. T33-2 TaxID=2054168 RepID=UPI0015E0DA93|nr:hypothetical protein [Bacillus sp. T33-2]